MATSPTTPSAIPRATHEIEALSDLVGAMSRHSRHSLEEDSIGHMDLEELEEEEGMEDLDADVEDMDDEELESSVIEGDSLEL